jgi:arylsulfatase A-like enzyme
MDRRQFLNTAAGGALAFPALGFQSAARPQTNLLVIVVDQLSGLALPTADSHARMPNVGKLTESGVLFSHAYTAGMTCGPSRASLDTGVFTQTHGVGGGFRQGADMPSLTGTLANAGYVSSHPDGYDLEKERALHEKWLEELGYQQPLSSLYGAESLARYLDLPLKWKCGRAGVAPEHGFDVYCAQRAIRFLETSRDKPFACFLQLRGPHDPYMTPRPFDTLVDPASIQVPPYRRGEFANKPARQRKSLETQGASKMTDDQLRRIMGIYYGMSAYSDYAIGLVMNRLRELKLDDNTVVALVSDHGDTMGRHRFMSKDFAFYEPAIRIPMIFRAPSRASGIVRTDPVSGIDLFPTLCDLMGLPAPRNIPGQSLVKRWEGAESDPARPIFAAQGTPGKNRAAMLRTGKFKYARYDDGGSELYDLAKDPDELDNVVDSAAYAMPLAQMKQQLAEHERRYPHRA